MLPLWAQSKMPFYIGVRESGLPCRSCDAYHHGLAAHRCSNLERQPRSICEVSFARSDIGRLENNGPFRAPRTQSMASTLERITVCSL